MASRTARLNPGPLDAESMKKLSLVFLVPLFLAISAHAELGTQRPCSGSILLRVPLTSSEDTFQARTPSGFRVKVSSFESGWSVGVFAKDDRSEAENLLAPRGEWNGEYSVPFWVLPESEPKLWLPNRIVHTRSGNQELCLSLRGAKVAGKPLRFSSGRLIVYASRGPAPN